jgi:ATP-dependent Lon protease
MILPAANKKDLVDIPRKAKKEMQFIFAEEINEVFKHALVKSATQKTKS